MNPLAAIRQRQVPWARRVLGLFVVVWLNMALQPCAMAIGDMQDRNCGHCPPAHLMDMVSSGTHQLHDKIPTAEPCETGVAQCGFLDNYNHDGRTVKVKDDHRDVPLGLVSAVAAMPVMDPLPVSNGRCDTYSLPGDPPSLNVLYCVYLK